MFQVALHQATTAWLLPPAPTLSAAPTACAARCAADSPSPARRMRAPLAHLVMQEPPSPLPYKVPAYEKPFADYEWDETYPGSFKPGTRSENYDLDVVLEMWEGRENPAAMELPQDQLWQVPLAPPEDILSWLQRIGLMEEKEEGDGEEEENLRTDSLLDDEFDLDEVDVEEDGGTFEM